MIVKYCGDRRTFPVIVPTFFACDDRGAMSLEFLIITLIIVASPGTGVIYTLAAGLSRGSRASILAAFACTLGIVPHLIAAMMGLAAVLHTSAVAYGLLKYAGVAYLLYMAWQTLREHGALKVETRPDARSGLRAVVDGILINILNPKLSIFFVAFLPQFIPVDATRPLLRMVELSGVFMAVTFIVFAIYGLFAAAMRDQVVGRPVVMKWMRRTFAGAFAALGAKLAFSDR
jgi:threonine/homoserine/homoserine lactone efflux protein